MSDKLDDLKCGDIDEPCCKDADIDDLHGEEPMAEAPGAPWPSAYYGFSPYYYVPPALEDSGCFYGSVCFKGTCVDEYDLPCGKVGEECCPEKYFKYTSLHLCHNDLVCSGGMCLSRSKLKCGGEDEKCCKSKDYPDQYYVGDDTPCFNKLVCIDDKCQGLHKLGCGEDGEKCCTADQLPRGLDMYDLFGEYEYREVTEFCFSHAECREGTCTMCAQEGDKCCYNDKLGVNYCKRANYCVDDMCVGCGQQD